MLGSSGWQVQSKFSVKLPNLNYDQLMQMRPNGDYMEQLKTLTRFAVGSELEFDFKLTTQRKNLPLFQLSSSGDSQPILGWNTQLSGESNQPEVTLNVH
jgi:predicted component of type VI protein secretion system